MTIEKIVRAFEDDVDKKANRGLKVTDDIFIENVIINELVLNPQIQPSKCAIAIDEKYNMNMTGNDVIRVFKSNSLKLGNVQERINMLICADETAEILRKIIVDKDVTLFDEYHKSLDRYKNHRQIFRMVFFAVINKIPQLKNSPSIEVIMKNFGSTYCKNCLNALIRITMNLCDSSSNASQKQKSESEIKYDELFDEYERVNQTLEDLQEEFNDRISEIKQQEITEFFSMLNSEKYGCIIDELFTLRKGFNQLRKTDYQFPKEIESIGVVFSKFMQLIKDSGIDPMIRPETVMTVTAGDIENYQYEGTPFESGHQEKKVKTISTGWIWKEKNIIISQPKIREIE